MNEAEERFAARLADDLERVLGAGIAIDDVELTAGDAGTDAQVRATLLIEGRMETIEVSGPDLLALYRPLVERAAELRLAGAFWRMIGPA
jgi:hypothetical protein